LGEFSFFRSHGVLAKKWPFAGLNLDFFAGRDVFLATDDQSFTGLDAGSYDGVFAKLVGSGHEPPFDLAIRPDNEDKRSGQPQLTAEDGTTTTLVSVASASMQSEGPLTLILSPLRAGRGELERTCLGSMFRARTRVPPKVPSPFAKGRGSGFVSTAWIRLIRMRFGFTGVG